MEKHGKQSCHGMSWKSHGKWANKNKVMEIQKVMEKSWNFSTTYRESRMRYSDNSISMGLLQWFGYGRLLVYVLNSKS